ncbi:MAG: ROK family protein [Chloroflexota bacterium]
MTDGSIRPTDGTTRASATARAADASTDGHAPAATRPLLVGVDVGGTKIAVLVVDRDNTVVASDVAPTEAKPQEYATDIIASVVETTLSNAHASIDDVRAIGVGVPGRVDPLTGSVTLAVNLGWSDLRLGPELEARLGRPTVVENDVRAAALGLHRRRVVGKIDNLAYLAVGTGVSAGVMLDGSLHRGARGLAGEIGHVIAEPGGARCACGQDGCLETLIAGSGIARQARAAIAAGRATTMPPEATAVDVYTAAADGDPLATEIADAVGRRLAWAIHLLVMAYDVERVVLGGGVSHAGETFMRPIRHELDRMRASSALAREQLTDDIVELLPPGADAGAWGAVIIAGAAHAADGAPVTGQGWEEVGHVRDP